MPKSEAGSKFRFIWLCLLVLFCESQGGGQTQKEPREVVDQVGRKVVLDGVPKRIVSLAPSVTETLFALGLESEIVGVTNYCDFPEAAKQKTKIGGIINPNYEVIASLKPGLLIATTSGNSKEAVEKLSRIGFPVYTVHAKTVAGTFQSILDIGEVTGKRTEADHLVETLRRRLTALREKIGHRSPKRVLFLVWYDPIIAPGKSSFINDALRAAGAESITADAAEAYPRYSLERIVMKRPDYIFLPKSGHVIRANIEREPGWQVVPAVIHKRIYFIDDPIQHPSPRLVDAIEGVAKILFPEVIK